MKLSEHFDFRMDKSSWFMLVFMVLTYFYFWILGAEGIPFVEYVKAMGFSILIVLTLLAIVSIPVLIYCYFVKMIPDIDYSIRVAFVFTIIGIITEFIF